MNLQAYLMLPRHIAADVRAYLAHFPSLLITGARQVGKSTLAMDLGIEHYVTLDDIASYQSAKADPKGFVAHLPRPVVIDEVQRVPEIFVALKEQIDRDRTPGRFVLTGSSSLQGFRNLSDSLAGRIGIIDLYAFNLSEIYLRPYNFIDHLFSGRAFVASGPVGLAGHLIKGGFPELQVIDHAKTRQLWFGSYIRTYIERDLHDVGNIRNLDSFMRLYLALALRCACLLNKAELGRACQIDNKTLDHYLSILKNTYQIALLKPWHGNALKRLVKMPKLFMLDTGILCHLLKITQADELPSSPYKGAVYETFVLTELVKANGYAARPVELSFYRTTDGKEIDFVLDDGRQMVSIEVKAALTVTPADFKHSRHFIEQNPGRVRQGILLYGGEIPLPFGEHQGTPLWALPLAIFAGGG